MSALNHIAAARDDAFAGRVLMLALAVAQQVATEDPATANHAERLAYADRVFVGNEQIKQLAAHVISSNPTIQQEIDNDPPSLGANVPDNDISFALSSIWTARAISFAQQPTATNITRALAYAQPSTPVQSKRG